MLDQLTCSLICRYPGLGFECLRTSSLYINSGPYLASDAIDFLTGVCVVASLQLAQSVLFPPAPRVGKLGNDLAPQGAVRRKEEACSGANVPWCYFAVSEITCATNQEITGLKSVARC